MDLAALSQADAIAVAGVIVFGLIIYVLIRSLPVVTATTSHRTASSSPEAQVPGEPPVVKRIVLNAECGTYRLEASPGILLTIKRGPETWTYLYIALGLAVAIESTAMAMIPTTVLGFPWNVLLYIAIVALTVWQFLENKHLHNALVGFKTRSENRAR